MINVPGIAPTNTARLKYLIAQCYDDPGRYARTILGKPPFPDPASPDCTSPYWWRQEEAAQLVARYGTTVLAQGNGTGKSWWLDTICNWYLGTRKDAIIITTAPTYGSLDQILWKNLRHTIANSRYPLGIKMTRSPLKAQFGEKHFILGISTTDVEKMSGHHAKHLMFVGDEASGIADKINEAADSLIPDKQVYTGNPLKSHGFFKRLYDQALEQDKNPDIPDAERVVQLRVPSTDSPHIHLPSSDVGMANRTWLNKQKRRYGENGIWYTTHVKAEFPVQSSESLIPEPWLDYAVAAYMNLPSPDPRRKFQQVIRVAVDLAEGRGGDRTVILVRDYYGILEVVGDNDIDEERAALTVAQMVAKYSVPHEQVSYDALGPVGRRFPGHLARHGIVTARPYKGSAGALEPREFYNSRTEGAHRLRQRLDPTIGPDPSRPHDLPRPFAIPNQSWWSLLREELTAHEYDCVGTQIRLLGKEAVKDRLGRSPDYADALFQSFAC